MFHGLNSYNHDQRVEERSFWEYCVDNEFGTLLYRTNPEAYLKLIVLKDKSVTNPFEYIKKNLSKDVGNDDKLAFLLFNILKNSLKNNVLNIAFYMSDESGKYILDYIIDAYYVQELKYNGKWIGDVEDALKDQSLLLHYDPATTNKDGVSVWQSLIENGYGTWVGQTNGVVLDKEITVDGGSIKAIKYLNKVKYNDPVWKDLCEKSSEKHAKSLSALNSLKASPLDDSVDIRGEIDQIYND
jgi:hypothetical protein